MSDTATSANDYQTMPQEPVFDMQPLIMYSRSLHDYTLSLWTEHRRQAEEKARAREKSQQDAIRIAPTAQRTTSSSANIPSAATNPASAVPGGAGEKHELTGHAVAAPPPSERSDSDSSSNAT